MNDWDPMNQRELTVEEFREILRERMLKGIESLERYPQLQESFKRICLHGFPDLLDKKEDE